jgi:hypothetical protein
MQSVVGGIAILPVAEAVKEHCEAECDSNVLTTARRFAMPKSTRASPPAKSSRGAVLNDEGKPIGPLTDPALIREPEGEPSIESAAYRLLRPKPHRPRLIGAGIGKSKLLVRPPRVALDI